MIQKVLCVVLIAFGVYLSSRIYGSQRGRFYCCCYSNSLVHNRVHLPLTPISWPTTLHLMALIVLEFVFLAGFRVATGISFPYSHWICECFEMFLLCKADVCQQHVKWAGQEHCPLLLFCVVLSPKIFTLPSER